jgi:hypothetical protein
MLDLVAFLLQAGVGGGVVQGNFSKNHVQAQNRYPQQNCSNSAFSNSLAERLLLKLQADHKLATGSATVGISTSIIMFMTIVNTGAEESDHSKPKKTPLDVIGRIIASKLNYICEAEEAAQTIQHAATSPIQYHHFCWLVVPSRLE